MEWSGTSSNGATADFRHSSSFMIPTTHNCQLVHEPSVSQLGYAMFHQLSSMESPYPVPSSEPFHRKGNEGQSLERNQGGHAIIDVESQPRLPARWSPLDDSASLNNSYIDNVISMEMPRPKRTKRSCKVDGCPNLPSSGLQGLCSRHSSLKCKRNGCPNKAKAGHQGFCQKHFAVVKGRLCRHPDCANFPRNDLDGLCVRHSELKCKWRESPEQDVPPRPCTNKAKAGHQGYCQKHYVDVSGRVCRFDGCQSYPRTDLDGFCVRHSEVLCKFTVDDGNLCTNKAKVGHQGFCHKHYAVMTNRYCKFEGCTVFPRTAKAGYCTRHMPASTGIQSDAALTVSSEVGDEMIDQHCADFLAVPSRSDLVNPSLDSEFRAAYLLHSTPTPSDPTRSALAHNSNNFSLENHTVGQHQPSSSPPDLDSLTAVPTGTASSINVIAGRLNATAESQSFNVPSFPNCTSPKHHASRHALNVPPSSSSLLYGLNPDDHFASPITAIHGAVSQQSQLQYFAT